MNKVILMGRLTRDADIRYAQNGNGSAVARFTLAVDRRFKREGDEQTADFISCVAFGKTAEFFERFGRKGMKFLVEGRIQTGSYLKDGQKVFTTDVVVEQTEFAESRQNNPAGGQPQMQPQNQGYAPQNQGYNPNPGYQQPQMQPQNPGYAPQQQNPNYGHQQNYNQQPAYNPNPGYQQAPTQMPTDDFGFGSIDGELPFG